MTDIDILNTSWKTEVTPEQSAEIQRLWINHKINPSIFIYKGDFICKGEKLNLLVGYPKEWFEKHPSNKINPEDIISALRKLEGDKTVSEETNDYGWISFKKSLPPIDHDIEIELIGGKIIETSIQFLNYPKNGFVFKGIDEIAIILKSRWRLKKQKRPNFGKLMEGDFIFYEWSNSNLKGKTAGFFDRIKDGCIDTFSDTNHEEAIIDSCSIDFVQKIYRINLETREIEEI